MKDIHDIKEPIALTFNFTPLIILAVILLLLLSLLIYLSLKNKSSNVNSILSNNKSNTPKTKALEALEQIEKDNLIEKEKIDLFYTRVTDIIKIYLLEQYLTKSDSKTTSEIVKDLKNLNLDYDFVIYTKNILIDLDRLKYANLKTSKDKMNKLLEALNKWIKEY